MGENLESYKLPSRIARRGIGGVPMEWDGPGMRSPNCPEAEQFVKRSDRGDW